MESFEDIAQKATIFGKGLSKFLEWTDEEVEKAQYMMETFVMMSERSNKKINLSAYLYYKLFCESHPIAGNVEEKKPAPSVVLTSEKEEKVKSSPAPTPIDDPREPEGYVKEKIINMSHKIVDVDDQKEITEKVIQELRDKVKEFFEKGDSDGLRVAQGDLLHALEAKKNSLTGGDEKQLKKRLKLQREIDGLKN